MAEKPDRESKTEEATPRRLDEALSKGNTPVSREVGPFFTILGATLTCYFSTQIFGGELVTALAMLLDRPEDIRLDVTGDATALLSGVARAAVLATIFPMLLLMTCGIAASIVQNPPRIALDRIRPQPSRISLRDGLTRVFGAQGRVEFMKAVVKLAILSAVVLAFLAEHKDETITIIHLNPRDLPAALAGEVASLLLFVAACLAALVTADVLWSRFKWRSDLRMSRQEVKDEQKQSEGDPIVRARQRSLARDRARRRMIAAVPRATVVIANPTHYAVALRYVRGEQATPVVLAKGLDSIALKIRAVAEEHGIPVIEDKALARSLHDAVVPDRPIPPEFYRAVAEIILFLMSRSSGTPAASVIGAGARQ